MTPQPFGRVRRCRGLRIVPCGGRGPQPKKKTLLYLASQSVRRREILRKMRIPFRVTGSAYRETFLPGLSPRRLALRHAVGKAKRAKAPAGVRWVLGADTLVVCRGRILGKPRTKKEAIGMLGLLSGHFNFVLTAVALLDLETGKVRTGVSKTKVFIRPLSAKEKQEYVRRIDPYDKAGGYAIQEGPRIVRKIEGSRSNVVGFPAELVRKMLKQIK